MIPLRTLKDHFGCGLEKPLQGGRGGSRETGVLCSNRAGKKW